MTADPAARRLHLFTALVLVAVFAAGAATGAGLAWAFRPPPRGGHGPGDVPPFVGELGLSPEQEAAVRAIAERHRPEIEAAVRETFPRVRAVQDRVDREIRALLTPAQAALFDELRNRRPPPRGPGMSPGPPGMPPGPPGMPPGPPPGPPP
jgi:Spy/CpxP family protein refolding chaperone